MRLQSRRSRRAPTQKEVAAEQGCSNDGVLADEAWAQHGPVVQVGAPEAGAAGVARQHGAPAPLQLGIVAHRLSLQPGGGRQPGLEDTPHQVEVQRGSKQQGRAHACIQAAAPTTAERGHGKLPRTALSSASSSSSEPGCRLNAFSRMAIFFSAAPRSPPRRGGPSRTASSCRDVAGTMGIGHDGSRRW